MPKHPPYRSVEATESALGLLPSIALSSAQSGTGDAAGVDAWLSDHQQRPEAGDESAQGTVSKLGHSPLGFAGLCPTSSRAMAKQNYATWCAPPGRAVVSTAGWTVGCAAHRARRAFSREPETSRRKSIASDSLDRPAAGRTVAGPDADAPPVPQQTAVVDLQWPGGGDARQ